MLLSLALNHSVQINAQNAYNASSPDELALVHAAKYLGYEFVSRSAKDNTVTIRVGGNLKIYSLLQVIEFTSSRKRMTSVFRDPSGSVLVLSKGADSILLPLCHENQDALKTQT
jgi:magnesium-transporting ATPase (P-type)